METVGVRGICKQITLYEINVVFVTMESEPRGVSNMFVYVDKFNHVFKVIVRNY